jgi:hypothetical protein
MQKSPDDGSRRVKNIAAILYLVVMAFLVGGSYIHQQSDKKPVKESVDQANQSSDVGQ